MPYRKAFLVPFLVASLSTPAVAYASDADDAGAFDCAAQASNDRIVVCAERNVTSGSEGSPMVVAWVDVVSRMVEDFTLFQVVESRHCLITDEEFGRSWRRVGVRVGLCAQSVCGGRGSRRFFCRVGAVCCSPPWRVVLGCCARGGRGGLRWGLGRNRLRGVGSWSAWLSRRGEGVVAWCAA